MIFSSIEFIYLFLPPVLFGFLVLRHFKLENAVIWWLIMASLFFYMWWSPIHLLLLLGSVGANFLIHRELLKTKSRPLLVLGITLNLLLLSIFKYADFLLGSFAAISGMDIPELGLILPLAISFFTFQQISFLCDTYKGNLVSCGFKEYVLFVTFFPQLIAGPIVLQKDTIPQFNLSSIDRRYSIKLVTGITLFAIGLFKKIVLADAVAPVANIAFGLADGGAAISMETAWVGALAYTFQIYFDFSGYCDMALGLALMFGIRLPINFNSPYKSTSIVEFWRRWHITLSRFLRDYLYIPLGGNRSGLMGAKGNLAITMLLGGLWHGAGWTFVIWGGLHGAFLMVNHAWVAGSLSSYSKRFLGTHLYTILSWGLTMACVVFAWVFFRAETFSGALIMINAMFGLSGEVASSPWTETIPEASFVIMQLLAMVFIVIALPNSIDLTKKYNPVLQVRKELIENRPAYLRFTWNPGPRWAAVISGMALVAIVQVYRLNDLTEFIYFNF